jgi:anti-sigma B factor antagonist
LLYVKRPWSHPEPKKPIVQRQLTANPSENPVLAASISLDGKQLAYYDRGKGLTLMLVDSGEKRTFPNSATMIPQDWYPDGTHLLVGGGGFTKTVQKMSVLDGTTKRILDLGEDFDLTLSPDGSQIAFVKDLSKGDMWLMTADVGEPRRILSVAPAKIYSFTWSPSSRRIIYLRYSPKEIALESCDTDGGHLVSALVNSRFQGANGLGGLAWLGNGSVLFRLSEPAPNKKFDNIWSLNVDPDTGRVRGQPIEVTTGPGFSQLSFSASSDGKRLVYLRGRTVDSARIATLQPFTGELGAFQSLAGEEWDICVSWHYSAEHIRRRNTGLFGLRSLLMDMTASVRNVGDVTVVGISGRIVLGDESAALRDLIAELLSKGDRKIVLDLADVNYIDSSGLGALVSSFATVRRQGGELKLVKLSDKVDDLMEVTRLYTVFDIADNEEEAIHSFDRSTAAGA